jgi:hypothetical protein
MAKIAGSESVPGSISQRHGSADPDPDPDPPQNVMDPQHCKKTIMMDCTQESGHFQSTYSLVCGI